MALINVLLLLFIFVSEVQNRPVQLLDFQENHRVVPPGNVENDAAIHRILCPLFQM